ncbi:putative transposase [Bradyrhizobium sp. USDA 4506]
MTRPYSEDIREGALARADAGETVRSIAEALQISPSCVTKWKNLRRDTGSLSPGKIGGHKKRVLSDTNADWLRERIRSGPFTLRKLTQQLAARGIKTDVRAVWTFVHVEGLSFKKSDPSQNQHGAVARLGAPADTVSKHLHLSAIGRP